MAATLFCDARRNALVEFRAENADPREDAAAIKITNFIRGVVALKTGERPFASRLVPASARDFSGEYDHLARVAEWSTADDGEGGRPRLDEDHAVDAA